MCNLEVDINIQRGSFQLEVKECFTSQVTGVFGPSGSGKSTLLNVISGLQQPQNGYISLNKNIITDTSDNVLLPSHKRKIGYVFQDSRLFPHLSVRKNLLFGAKNNNGESPKIKFSDVIDVLEINKLLEKSISNCSGGEQQRIAIGRALLTSPELLLLDEPFSAVDYQLRKQILLYIRQISDIWKIPMLVVSHDLPDLLSLTDSLLIIKNGEVLGNGLFKELVVKNPCLDIMHSSGILNVFRLYVFSFLKEKNLILLKSYTNEFIIQALIQTVPSGVKINDEIQVLIRPEDIALSQNPIEGISIRNQIEGTIEAIFEKDGYSICMVNAGEKILVEITEASRKRMKLDIGLKVFCLFKSTALKIY